MSNDLLSPQCDQRGFIRRQSESLVISVSMQRLSSAQYSGKSLDCDTHDVVQRLLRGERDARGLSVKAKRPRTRVPGIEALGHDLVPNSSGCTVLGDLFKEIVVRVEKETQSRRELIDVHSAIYGVLCVLDSVSQRERKLL